MLVYMKPELIEAVKKAAAATDQKAWQFVEKAVGKALKGRKAWPAAKDAKIQRSGVHQTERKSTKLI